MAEGYPSRLGARKFEFSWQISLKKFGLEPFDGVLITEDNSVARVGDGSVTAATYFCFETLKPDQPLNVACSATHDATLGSRARTKKLLYPDVGVQVADKVLHVLEFAPLWLNFN